MDDGGDAEDEEEESDAEDAITPPAWRLHDRECKCLWERENCLKSAPEMECFCKQSGQAITERQEPAEAAIKRSNGQASETEAYLTHLV